MIQIRLKRNTDMKTNLEYLLCDILLDSVVVLHIFVLH